MVKELVKKKKKGQRRAVKRSPPTNAIKTRELPWTNHPRPEIASPKEEHGQKSTPAVIAGGNHNARSIS